MGRNHEGMYIGEVSFRTGADGRQCCGGSNQQNNLGISRTSDCATFRFTLSRTAALGNVLQILAIGQGTRFIRAKFEKEIQNAKRRLCDKGQSVLNHYAKYETKRGIIDHQEAMILFKDIAIISHRTIFCAVCLRLCL
jgi:intergrase/recombinase